MGLGVLILGAVYTFAVLVSNDMRVVYAIGVVLLFGSAVWMGARGKGDWWSLMLLTLPLITGFGYLVLQKMPVLWPHLLSWSIATMIGSQLLSVGRSRRMLAIYGAVLFGAASLWYCLRYVPEQVARSLSHFGDTAAPVFTF